MAAKDGPKVSVTMRNIILDLSDQGCSTVKICKILQQEFDFKITRQAILYILKNRNKPTKRKETARKFTKLHTEVLDFWLSENRDLTAKNIQTKFWEDFKVKFSLTQIRFYKRKLGWTMKRKNYCQLISNKNKTIRMNWCMEKIISKETFENVVFVDETNVELNSAARLSFYKVDSSMERIPARCAKPKHAYQVHVWAGISYRGRTNLCIFTGIMDSVIYQKILEDNLLPFVHDKFPDGFRLYQDNDSKHKSKSTRAWMTEKGIIDSVMVTPASSPDINPIENVWSTMKDFLQREIKPKTKQQLVDGIIAYWDTLTTSKCRTFIDHIHIVMPVVVLNSGNATDY